MQDEPSRNGHAKDTPVIPLQLTGEAEEEGKQAPAVPSSSIPFSPALPTIHGAGVLGEVLDGSERSLGNMSMIERALRQDYPISRECRRLIVDRMEDIIRSNPGHTRKCAAAAKVILAADGLNAKREKIAVDARADEDKDGRERMRIILSQSGLRSSMADVTAKDTCKVNVAIESQVVDSTLDSKASLDSDTRCQPDATSVQPPGQDSAAVG